MAWLRLRTHQQFSNVMSLVAVSLHFPDQISLEQNGIMNCICVSLYARMSVFVYTYIPKGGYFPRTPEPRMIIKLHSDTHIGSQKRSTSTVTKSKHNTMCNGTVSFMASVQASVRNL